jgi:ParB/RepB/Spo0J family partition protein
MQAVSSRPSKRSFSIARQTFTSVAAAPSIPTPAIYLEVERIAPATNNPRRKLGDIAQLAESIDTYGLLQPLVVREAGESYELIAGHRRLAAIQHLRGLDPARLAKWHQVTAIVHTADDERALLLAGQENLQRQDLSPRDQALYLELYVRKYGGVRKAAEVLKLSHTYVGQRCRVFADDVLAGPVMANQLDVSSAQELLRVADPVVRAQIAQQAVTGSWSRLRIRQEVDRWNVDIPARGGRPSIKGKLEAMLRELEAISPDSLSAEEVESARRLTSRLMWMLGPTSDPGEPTDANTGPRIISWVGAPA